MLVTVSILSVGGDVCTHSQVCTNTTWFTLSTVLSILLGVYKGQSVLYCNFLARCYVVAKVYSGLINVIQTLLSNVKL